MTDRPKHNEDNRNVGADDPTIQVDFYGIKAKGTVSDSGESQPRTWREVADAINGHLKSIAVSVFGLLDDIVRGSRNLVRGLTGIPEALRSRIQSTHNHTDFEEWSKQRDLENGILRIPDPQTAADELNEILESLKGNGFEVSLFQLPDGTWCVGLVPPEFTTALPEVVDEQKRLELEDIEDDFDDDVWEEVVDDDDEDIDDDEWEEV